MRPEGWESILADHIASARAVQFAWGTHDCVLWCADWVSKITGIDLAAEFRGGYDSEEGAQRVMGDLGYSSISDLVGAHLTSILIQKAQRGDIMQHPSGMLGICDGPFAYFLTFQGVLRIPFLRCSEAWKV